MTSERNIPFGRPGFAATVLGGGLIAGLLDGLDAIIFFGLTLGATPTGIFQHIASGVLGSSSFRQGWRSVGLGVLLHLSIAVGAALVFYVASLKLPVLIRQPFLSGPAFGLVVFFVMYRIVVPLSAVAKRTQGMSGLELVDEFLAHTLLVGLPIALMARRSARMRTPVDSA